MPANYKFAKVGPAFSYQTVLLVLCTQSTVAR